MNIATIIPKVVENMKSSSQLKPTVYAELDNGTTQAYPMLHFIGDARMKCHLLFTAGRDLGQKHKDRELVETCLSTEVWLTQGTRNPNPGQKPPSGIPSKEAVMFAVARNAEPYQTVVKIYELMRDKQRKPTELVFLSESTDERGLMGVAFIAGWYSRHMTDSEVQALQPQGMRAFLQQ